MNQQYAGDHVDSLLDYVGQLSVENDELRQLLISALRILQEPEVFGVLTDQQRITGAGIQAFLNPPKVPYSELTTGSESDRIDA